MSDHYKAGERRRMVAGEGFFAATGENWLGQVIRLAQKEVRGWAPYKREYFQNEQRRANR